jgi:hypothetical protein
MSRCIVDEASGLWCASEQVKFVPPRYVLLFEREIMNGVSIKTKLFQYWQHCKTVSNYLHIVGFEVLTAVSMKMVVFWVVAPCSQGDDNGGSKDL